MKTIIKLLILIIIANFNSFPQTKFAMVLGDSNGAFDSGWVYQLSKLHPEIYFINFSIPGNTIGFNNLNKDTLNTLKNIQKYFLRAYEKTNQIDYIFIMLGTNDCKKTFDLKQNEVIINFESLLDYIANYNYPHKKPEIILITPPPAGEDSILQEKYHGIKKRLEKNIPEYLEISNKYKIHSIDIYNALKKDFNSLTVDGIHFNINGYKKIANLISSYLKEKKILE